MLSCGIVFRSVGYRGVSLPGVPFDEKTGTIPNEGGRVEPGLYAAGWIKRGPTGVIGTNKKDATETVELLLEDAAAGRSAAERSDRGRRRRAPRRARSASRHVHRMAGDRRARAGGRREARAAARQALHVGRVARRGGAGSRPYLRRHDEQDGSETGAVGRRDHQGDRELPRLGRADPGAGRALARSDQGRSRARERGPRPARPRQGRSHRRRRRAHRERRARRPVPDRRLPDRLRHLLEHECERGDRNSCAARGSTRTTT